MGFFRLFFALSIVIIHAYPLFGYILVSSSTAVCSFFVISGFYMALILHEKYIGKNGSYRLFIVNRFLRIYPLYWVILLLLVALSATKFIFFPQQSSALKILFDFTSLNPDYLGNLVMSFLRNTTLIVTTDYFHQNFHDPGYLLLLPAWTLQIELLFYLIAPLLAKIKTSFLFLIALPFVWVTFGNPLPLLHADLSITTIFLTKIIFFIFGILSYAFYKKIKTKPFSKRYGPTIFALFFLFALLSSYLPLIQPLYYVTLALAIPFIFLFSKNQSLDAFFGDLSYPVYLSHLLIFKLITNSPLAHLQKETITVLTMLVTLFFSFLLVKTLEKPIDRFRQQRLR